MPDGLSSVYISHLMREWRHRGEKIATTNRILSGGNTALRKPCCHRSWSMWGSNSRPWRYQHRAELTVNRPRNILVVDFFVQWSFIFDMGETVVMGKLVSNSLEPKKDDLPLSLSPAGNWTLVSRVTLSTLGITRIVGFLMFLSKGVIQYHKIPILRQTL